METCGWKLVDPEQFELGMEARRCGKTPDVQVFRPNRRKDLFLCEDHLNCFIERWGLHYRLRILVDWWGGLEELA